MNLKKRIPLLFFLCTFSVWLVSLFLVYLPITGNSQTFPRSIDAGMMNIFLVSAAMSFTTAFVMGLREILPLKAKPIAISDEKNPNQSFTT